jgi:ornithine carbamoyltransferase
LIDRKPGAAGVTSLACLSTVGVILIDAVLKRLPSAGLDELSPEDVELLLGNARLLRSAVETRQAKTLLRGKRLALLCEREDSADALLFRGAAAELGVDVSHIRPHLSELSRPEELRQTARILGRLYDGIECQGLLPALCDAVGREAGVPVYDGLASNRHATAQLAALLGADEPPERLREIVLQTVLLSTLA